MTAGFSLTYRRGARRQSWALERMPGARRRRSRRTTMRRFPPIFTRPGCCGRGVARAMALFAFFESRIRPTAMPGSAPPQGLLAFYWHFIRQAKPLFGAMFVTGLLVALIDTLIPLFIGRLVRLMEATDRAVALDAAMPSLLAMGAAVLIGRPLALLLDSLVRNNAVVPGVTSLIRWQSHWHVVRQSWPFFQNDFAGRIANRVMQTSNAVRESVVSCIRAVWYIIVYGLSALVLMAMADWRLALPTVAWFVGYVVFLRHFVPQMRDLAKSSSELRSQVMGRVVDSYTNILTVKLFARARDEDAYVREVIDEHSGAIAAHMRLITTFMTTLSVLNAMLLVGTAAIGVWLWSRGTIDAGTVATALPLAWAIANVAGFVSWEVTGIFENVGVVQEGMETIAVPHAMTDRPGARELQVQRGEIRFEHVTFTYGRPDGRKVLDDLSLMVKPGERVGLVGRSGAGKSTLVNLLLRFHDMEQGSVRVDGHDIRGLSQESLRAAIGLVTQDTSLLRSWPRPARRRRTSSSSGCRTGRAAPATTPTWANAASSSAAASASASPSRAWS
jgi:ATP-binding cassette subfamily B multidrug efflux pump